MSEPNGEADEYTPNPEDVLRHNRKVYYRGLMDTLLAGMGKGEMNHESAITVCLGVAGGIASDLGEGGIALFEQLAASKLEHMRASLEAYGEATDPKLLQ